MPNKIVREFNQKHFEPVKSWNIKSSHCHPDTGEFTYYLVEKWADGEWTCSCPAGFYGKNKKKCYHILQKMDELSEEKYK